MTSREKVTRGLFIHIYYTLEYGKKKKRKINVPKKYRIQFSFPILNLFIGLLLIFLRWSVHDNGKKKLKKNLYTYDRGKL